MDIIIIIMDVRGEEEEEDREEMIQVAVEVSAVLGWDF